MGWLRSTVTFLTVFTLGCGGTDDPMVDADKRYTKVMVTLAQADRDATRNVRNREARKRKVAAENARTAFFKSRIFKEAMENSKDLTEPTLIAKRDGYLRHKLIASSWTEDEKKEETRLLGRLDELNGVEATWSSPDGKTEVSLNGGWRQASKTADHLSETDRQDLASSYVEHRMRVVGADLQALVKLRNTVAKRAGFDNYWELGLASQGLTPKNVEAITAELTEIVSPIAKVEEQQIAEAATTNGI